MPAAADAWFLQTAGRVGGAFGARSPGFYPLQLLLMTLPWTPLWVWVVLLCLRRHGGAAAVVWAKRPGTRPDRRLRAAWRVIAGGGDAAVRRLDRDLFPLIWLGATVAVLSLSVGRNRHYLLPALAACSLLAGRGIAAALALAARGRTFGGRLRGRRTRTVAWGLPALGAAAFVAAMLFPPSRMDSRADRAAFVRSLPDRLPGGEPILVLGMGETSALWHLPPTARRTEDAAGLADALRRRGRVAVLADERSAWQIDRCAAAWRAAGGACASRWVAEEAPSATRPAGGFEPLRGLRLAIVEATPPPRPVPLRQAAAGGVILY